MKKTPNYLTFIGIIASLILLSTYSEPLQQFVINCSLSIKYLFS